jgi:hypothetical protein
MSDKLKNILSNILGISVFIFGIYSLVYGDLGVIEFSLLSVIGLGLFLFKASKSREWIGKFLSKKLEN